MRPHLLAVVANSAYLTHLLAVQVVAGAGVELTINSLIGAGGASLTPARFGTGSGVFNMARQVGTVLGGAGLVAVLAPVEPSDPVVTYRHGVLLVVLFFLAAGAVSSPVDRPGRSTGQLGVRGRGRWRVPAGGSTSPAGQLTPGTAAPPGRLAPLRVSREIGER
jgi:hypothetical protein